MKTHHKVLTALFAFIVIFALIAFVATHPQNLPVQDAPLQVEQATSTPEESAEQATTTPETGSDDIVPITQGIAVGEPHTITVEGTQVCLPFKDTNAIHTMICAIGLRTDSGTYYALHDTDSGYANLSQFSGDGTYEVKGLLKPGSDPTYVSEGTIEVSSVEKLNQQ